jgi:hypothetical protein
MDPVRPKTDDSPRLRPDGLSSLTNYLVVSEILEAARESARGNSRLASV